MISSFLKYYFCIFQAPSFNVFRQTPFEVYSIEYTVNNVSTTVEFVDYPAMDYTIAVMNNTRYSIRVALNNSAGLGEYSSPPLILLAVTVGKSAVMYVIKIHRHRFVLYTFVSYSSRL